MVTMFSVCEVKDGAVKELNYLRSLNEAKAYASGRYDGTVKFLPLSDTVMSVTGDDPRFMRQDVYIVEVKMSQVELDEPMGGTAVPDRLYWEIVESWDKFEASNGMGVK